MSNKDALKAALSVMIVLFLAYVGLDAFFGLVGDIYRFLDQFIWAFFAGVIAFFISIGLTGIIIMITVYTVTLLLAAMLALVGFIIEITR